MEALLQPEGEQVAEATQHEPEPSPTRGARGGEATLRESAGRCDAARWDGRYCRERSRLCTAITAVALEVWIAEVSFATG